MTHFRPWPLLLLAFCIVPRVFASDAPYPEISALQNKLLMVRGFYRSPDLHFAANRTFEGSPEKGFGPGDGLIHVAEVKISGRRLTFTGDHPLMYYDPATDKPSFRTGWSQRRVTIDLPPNADRSTAEQAVWAVFYKPIESVLPGCTSEDKEFRKTLMIDMLTVRDGKKTPYPSTGLCLPFGERIRNHVGENALAPKPLSTPDPAIPQDAPRELDALVILGVVVDSSGHPQTIMVLKSQSYNFDVSAAKTVSSWKFKPATFQDQPVPVFIKVEINYHRH